MRPQRGNSGKTIRAGAKYKEAAEDFFEQHKDL